MKQLALALVVVALIAADFFAPVAGLPARQQHAWALADTVGIYLGGFVLCAAALRET